MGARPRSAPGVVARAGGALREGVAGFARLARGAAAFGARAGLGVGADFGAEAFDSAIACKSSGRVQASSSDSPAESGGVLGALLRSRIDPVLANPAQGHRQAAGLAVADRASVERCDRKDAQDA